MATRHMDAALGRLGASLQEELNSTLQPLVQQIVIQSTQICVDLCKDRLSELLDQVENRGAPVDPVYTAVTKGRGPTPEEAARASAKLLVSAALLSSGVLVEAPETVGFTTQSTQTVTVPVPVAPVPVVPVAPSATAATVATAAATASITSHSATGTPATAAKAAAPMAPSPVAKKATPVPKAAQAAQAFKAMPQKAPPLQPQAAQAASPLPVPKPKVEPRKSFAEQVAVGVSSIFGKSTPPKAKSKESVQTGPPPSVMSMIRKSYQAAAKSEEQPKDVKEEKTPIPKPKTPGRVSTRSVQALPRKTQRSSAVGEEDLSV